MDGDHRSIAHGPGKAILRQEILGGLVGIFSHGEQIIARVKDIGLGRIRVVRFKALFIDLHLHRFASARGEKTRLFEGDELNGGFLDAVRHIVIGVRLLEVDLDGVFARIGARVVGHLDGDKEFLATIRRNDLEIGIREFAIGETMPKRIAHDIIVDKVPDIGPARNDIIITGLIISVANVDAFVIDAEDAVGGIAAHILIIIVRNGEVFAGV